MSNLLFLLKAIIMGIVEGITEFLPISSTGHLIIVGQLIGFHDLINDHDWFVKLFEVVIQLGAILAIAVLYWDKIRKSFSNLKPSQWGFKLWFNIILAFIPAGVFGLLLKSKIDKYLFTSLSVAFAMVVGGILLIIIENKYRKKNTIKDINNINGKQSVLIGLFQCLSLWPGMSRSASTIMGGWIAGLSNEAAAEFSFFLAIPTMIAASGWDLIKNRHEVANLSSIYVIALGLGFVVAFIVALLVVEKFIDFLKKKSMRVFGVYRIIVGIVLLILICTKVINVIVS